MFQLRAVLKIMFHLGIKIELIHMVPKMVVGVKCSPSCLYPYFLETWNKLHHSVNPDNQKLSVKWRIKQQCIYRDIRVMLSIHVSLDTKKFQILQTSIVNYSSNGS